MNTNIFKRLVKTAFEKAGYEIRRPLNRMPADARHGIKLLDYLVDEIISKRGVENITLLQVGANDGVNDDDVNSVLKKHTVRSLLVEPIPEAFAKLKSKYQSSQHVSLARCAIADFDGTLDIYRISPQHSPHDASNVSSFDRTHVEQFIELWELPKEALVVEPVECKSIKTLLTDFGLSSVDIVVIDTEGMDHIICSQILGLSSLPDIIQFEYVNCPILSITKLMEDLTELGYQFVRSGLDITASRDSSN